MNDRHALGELCRSRDGAGAGDQVLKNAWRIGRTSPKGRIGLGTPWLRVRLLCGPAAVPGGQRARRAPSSAQPCFRFGPPPAIGRGSRAPPPAVPAPRPSRPPPAEILGEGAGRADPRPGLGALSNAPKRRGERAGEGGSRLRRARARASAGGCPRRGGSRARTRR